MLNYVKKPNFILEIGCGTGKFGAKFSNDGFFIVGIDKAINMLRVAKTRAYKNFRIFSADMKEFYISRKPDFVFCVHDTINYLLCIEDIKQFFLHIKSLLKKDSVFMFDMTTEYNIFSNFNNKKMQEKHQGREITWNNFYNRTEKIVRSILTFSFNDTYLIEEHEQRIYSIDEISAMLKETGFYILDICSDYTMMEPNNKTVMVNFIVKLI